MNASTFLALVLLAPLVVLFVANEWMCHAKARARAEVIRASREVAEICRAQQDLITTYQEATLWAAGHLSVTRAELAEWTKLVEHLGQARAALRVAAAEGGLPVATADPSAPKRPS